MAKINVLPKNIAELIAAGEVCERPANVVKELIENSIDAGADKITVEIRSGGVKYIRITDNGSGISREDVPTAFLSHATSKIKSSEDLDAIHTLGFRGEALASVCAVSKTEILTKTENESFGSRYVVEGGEEILLDDAGCPPGTTIIVRDLFYNTPARMKFLKKDATEGNYISDVLARAALSHPEISFRLIKDDKESLFTPGSGELLDAIFAVHGKDFAQSLIPCQYEGRSVKISGFVSKPMFGRGSRNMQHFFVNMRYVKIPFAAKALDQAYKNSIMTGKFPSAVIFIEVPPETLDVNVHPAKTEVRFADEKRVFEAVYYGAKNAIAKGDTRPKLEFSDKKQVEAYHSFLDKHKDIQQPENFQQEKLRLEPIRPKEPIIQDYSSSLQGNEMDYGHRETPPPPSPPPPTPTRNQSFLDIHVDDFPVLPPTKEDIPQQAATESSPPIDLIVVGELFQTYMIIEHNDSLLLIDKHAAHERMLYNELRSVGTRGLSQTLLAPVSVTLNRREYSAILENLNLLKEAGYVVEDFGEGTVLVRECPLDMPFHEIESVIEELADHLCSHVKELVSEKLDWLYHNTACRAAVKAGSKMQREEIEDFAKKILSDPSLRYCPHGRPIWIEISRKDLEKQFGRVQ